MNINWIPLEEQEPEVEQTCWLWCEYAHRGEPEDHVYAAWQYRPYDGVRFWYTENEAGEQLRLDELSGESRVTHWAPFEYPEPPDLEVG